MHRRRLTTSLLVFCEKRYSHTSTSTTLSANSSERSSERLSMLLLGLKSQGATILNIVKVGHSSTSGYGLFASHSIKKGDNIITVPPPIWLPLSAEYAVKELMEGNPELYQRMKLIASKMAPSAQDNLMKSCSLALLLLLEKHHPPEPSTQRIYLDCLEYPGVYHPLLDNVTNASNSEADELLHGTSVKKAIQMRRHVFHGIGDALFGNDQRLKNLFLWGMSLVQSRALSGGTDRMPLTLVPGIDLANHSMKSYNACHRFDHTTSTFSLVATRDVQEQEELLISYGEGRDTPSFMALYAFFEANNPNDAITLLLSKGSTKRDVVLPLDYLLSLQTGDIHLNMVESMREGVSALSMDKEILLRQHAEEVIQATQQALDKSLLATARAVINMASATGMEITSSSQKGEEKVIQLVLSSCDLALAAFLPSRNNTSSVVNSDGIDHLQFVTQLDERLQYLLRIATNASTSTSITSNSIGNLSSSTSTSTSSHWHRHCALAASRELDGLLRLRGICQAYATALSVRHRISSLSI